MDCAQLRFATPASLERSDRVLDQGGPRPSPLVSRTPGDEAISGVAWRTAVLEIGSLQPSNPVLADGREFGAQIELVEARRVVAEDRTLDRAVGGSEGGKPVL